MAWKIKCYISKSKLIICEYNAFYFSEIAFIGFTLHEIKQGIVFFGTPGICGIFGIILIIKFIHDMQTHGKDMVEKENQTKIIL
jgi:hypothetical protein